MDWNKLREKTRGAQISSKVAIDTAEAAEALGAANALTDVAEKCMNISDRLIHDGDIDTAKIVRKLGVKILNEAKKESAKVLPEFDDLLKGFFQ